MNEVWEKRRNKEDCVTNANGPNKHHRCRFPFFYKGRLWNQCVKSSSPSSGNRICKQFKADKGKEAMPKEGESIMIEYEEKRGGKRTKYYRERKTTICYSEGFKVQ